jgi:hypothetical protein
MDPNRTLAELLAHAAAVLKVSDEDGDMRPFWDEVERTAELIQALDGWIAKGGFLPDRWRVRGNG